MAILATDVFSNSTLQFAVLGLGAGALYALVALGIVLVYRASGVLNFAGAALGAVAAFAFYSLRDQHDMYWLLALVIALLLGAALGVVARFVVMGLLAHASMLAKVIATLGLLTIAQSLIDSRLIFDYPRNKIPESILSDDPVSLGGDLFVAQDRLVIVGLAIALAFVLRIVYSKTTFGLATSAVAESRRVASANGLSPTSIEVVNFAVAGVLSALAAILIAPIVGLDAAVLSLTVIPALAAALAGRFSSFAVTVAAALGIGVLSTELSLFQSDIATKLGVEVQAITGLPQVVPLLIIILVTVFQGKARLQRGEVLARLPLPGSGRVNPLLVVAGTGLGVAMLFALSDRWADAFVTTFATGILVLSVVVVTGLGGQLSLCQFALAGFGAWVAARLAATQDMPFELALVIGVLAAIPMGLLVALPALRTRGVNLAVATLGLALMINAIIFRNGELTGGFGGTHIDQPSFFGIDLEPVAHPERYGAFVLIVFVLLGLAGRQRSTRPSRTPPSRGSRQRASRRVARHRRLRRQAVRLLARFRDRGRRRHPSRVPQHERAIHHVRHLRIDQRGALCSVGRNRLGRRRGHRRLERSRWRRLEASEHALRGPSARRVVAAHRLRSRRHRDPETVSGRACRALLEAHRTAPASRSTVRPRAAEPTPRRDRANVELEVRALTVVFGGVTALDDVGFTVRPGEVTGLIGPNGAGKTTLLDVMTGFTKQRSGSVLLDGAPIDGWSPERRARAGLGRSWQAVELFEEMTVRENLLVAADRQAWHRYLVDLLRPGRPTPSVAMNEVIEEFDLAQHLDARPSSLPQGTSRLVGIARAMSTEPSMLLLDEPAAGLDAAESVELGQAIRNVAASRGIGILIIEHDVSLLLSICDRIVVLDFGRKIAEGTPDEVATNPDVIRAYLGEPSSYGRGIDESVPMDPAGAAP